MKKPKQFRRFAWGGFVDGKLRAELHDMGWGGFGKNTHPSLAVFLTRAGAKAQHQDVRKIEIIEVALQKRRRS